VRGLKPPPEAVGLGAQKLAPRERFELSHAGLRRSCTVRPASVSFGSLGRIRTGKCGFRRPDSVSDGKAVMERMMGLEPMGSTLATLRNGHYATPAYWLLHYESNVDLSVISRKH
jgi:hypothetical protein